MRCDIVRRSVRNATHPGVRKDPMFRTLVKVLVVAGVVLGLTAFFGLFVMSNLARIDGVAAAAIPNESYLSGSSQMCDYADAYRIPMEFNPFRNIDDVADNAFEKGRGEIHRTDKEVVYEGIAPGLRYDISYLLERRTQPSTLTVCTTVRCETRTGRIYLTLVKPIHKMLLPYMVKRMSNAVVE